MEMISTFMPGLGHWWWKKAEIQEQKDDIFQIMQSPNIFGTNYFISWLITIWVINIVTDGDRRLQIVTDSEIY